MANSAMSELIQHLRRTALVGAAAGMTDGQLLECFVSRREGAAVEALVRRHGPMVWGVCRRVLQNHHDAEDAFQATFLVLVRKAASIVPREMVANWLYGVAHQTALKARATVARRKARERQVTEMPQPEAAPHGLWNDLQPLIDQELSRLPDKSRVVLLLCDLEGKTRKEAARQLGWPEGTVAGRLARARTLLAQRLARQGVVLSGLSLGLVLSHHAASACVPTAVASATIQAATLVAAGQAVAPGVVSAKVAALTEGVLKTMLLSKLKIATAVLVAVAVLGSGAGLLRHQALAEKPTAKAVKVEGSRQRTEVSGVVKAVDAAQNTITLQSKALGQKTYEVARDAKLLLDDGTGKKTGFREGRLADLTEGAVATLKLSADQKAVVIHVEGPHVQGILKAVDAAARTLTVTVNAAQKGEQPADKNFQVAADAGVSIDDGTDKKVKGKGDKLADLTTGSVVTLKLSADQKLVGHISAQGRSVIGVLRAVDAGKSTITVGVKDGAKAEDKTFEVARGARVLIDEGKPGKSPPKEDKLANLTPGAVVTLRLSLDQKAAVAIRAEGATLRGLLKAVDAAQNRITVTVGQKGEQPEDQTLDVARNARIQIDGGKEGKLADLPTEAHVTVKLSADQKAVIAIDAEGPAVGGRVRGTAGNDSITFGDKTGVQTFPVAKDARVVIEDTREGKLSDLIDGSVISARLSADKKEIIGTIRAEGPSFRGIIKSLDTSNNTITLTIGGKGGVGGEDKTFALTKDTSVQTAINGVSLKVADLRAEKEVVLRLSLDQKAAARITVLGE